MNSAVGPIGFLIRIPDFNCVAVMSLVIFNQFNKFNKAQLYFI